MNYYSTAELKPNNKYHKKLLNINQKMSHQTFRRIGCIKRTSSPLNQQMGQIRVLVSAPREEEYELKNAIKISVMVELC